jgi:predicted MFS family arabinose efflux permease
MKIPGGFSAIRQCLSIADYRLYMFGNISHGLGVWNLRMAIGWLAWELTESTAWLGGMAMAETAPTLILALIAGTIVDRVDYFKMMRITQGLSMVVAAIMALMTFTGVMTIWILFFLTICRGCLMAFNRPSRMSLIHPLVGQDLIAPALAIGSIIFNVTRFLGPALGGFVIVNAGVGWAFATTAFLLFIYSVVLGLMKITIAPKKREAGRSMVVEITEGLSYIMGHGGIRLQLALLALVGILARPVSDLLPGFAGKEFSTGADGLAMLLSAQGMGAAAGAIWIAARPSGIAGMTRMTVVSILLLACGLMLFATTQIFWLAVVFAGMLGFSFILLTVSNQTLIQAAVDPGLRGRVMSTYGLIMQGVPALGALLMGTVAEHIGLRTPVFIGGAICLGVWLMVWRQRAMMEISLEGKSSGR